MRDSLASYNNKDISNGVELKPVAVRAISLSDLSASPVVQSPTSFIYIKTVQIDPALEEFETNEGCDCQQCGDSTCPCFKSGGNGNSFSYMKFCDPLTCLCSSENCANHGTGSGENKFQLNASLEVFFVNTQKKWGVRTRKKIGKNVYVCEYAGILTKDNDDVQEDSYIFTLDYEDGSKLRQRTVRATLFALPAQARVQSCRGRWKDLSRLSRGSSSRDHSSEMIRMLQVWHF